MTKQGDTSKGSDSTGIVWLIGVGAVVLWGAALAVWDWWVANPAVRTVLIWVFSVVGILHVAALVVVVWARRSGGAVGRGGVSGGWERGEREVFAVVPVVGGIRKRPPFWGIMRGGCRRWSSGRCCYAKRTVCLRRRGWFVCCGVGTVGGWCGACRLIGTLALALRERPGRFGPLPGWTSGPSTVGRKFPIVCP